MVKLKELITSPGLFVLLICFGFVIVILRFNLLRLSERYDVPSLNLLQNGSFEQIDAEGKPMHWKIETSGSTVSYSQRQGYVGSHNFTLAVSDYKESTIRIESPKIVVTANDVYFFKTYALADIDANVLVHYFYKDASEAYIWKALYPSVDDTWSSMSTAIKPDDTVDSVAFVIDVADEGFIALDGAYVIKDNEITVDTFTRQGTNLLPNPTLEEGTATDPKGWVNYTYGTNQPSFGYNLENGNHFLTTRISNYVDGEAKWQYLPLPVVSQQYVDFAVDYRSSTFVDVIVEYRLADGSARFSQIDTLFPTQTWTQYHTEFEAVPNTEEMFVSLVLHRSGFVDSDNYYLANRHDGGKRFDTARISITFDDGWLNSYMGGGPILEEYGYFSTYYINAGTIGKSGYLSKDQLRDLRAQGHQIASHADQHDDLTSISQRLMRRELYKADDYIRNLLGLEVVDFAIPFGKHDALVDKVIKERYASHRGTQTGINTLQNFDLYDLKMLFIRPDSSAALVEEFVREAQSTNGWLIIVYHQISDNAGDNTITADLFREHMDVIKASQLPVMTVRKALEELQPQITAE